MLSGTICQKNDQEPMRIQNSGQTIVSIDAIDHSIEKYFLVYKIWFAYLANFRMRIDELNAVSYHILISIMMINFIFVTPNYIIQT